MVRVAAVVLAGWVHTVTTEVTLVLEVPNHEQPFPAP